MPLFEPPDGLSAAAVRYIRRMGYDNRVFAAAIVESGVKGKLRLVEGEKGWFSGATTTIHRTADGGDMPPPERDMLQALFSGGDSIEMDKANHAIFGAARDALKEKLQEAYLGPLFLRNHGWAWVGVVLMLAAMLFVGSVVAFADIYAELGERLLPATGFLLLVGAVLTGINSRFARKDGNWVLAGISALLALGGSAFVGLAFAWGFQTEGLLVLWMAAPLLALPLVISAFIWMAAPTREGRLVMDRIAGFERYLSITEEDRLEVLHPPEKTPELFERYLPYAIALGVENRWAGKFAARARRRRGRAGPPAGHVLVFRKQRSLVQSRHVRDRRRRLAGEQRRLGRDRARIEQRLGRRRLVRRRRRRRRRRRLVRHEGDHLSQSEMRNLAQHAGNPAGRGRRRDRDRLSEDAADQGRAEAALRPRRAHAAPGPAAKEQLARDLDLVEGAVSDDAILEAMAENPILIERPLVETEKGVRLARPRGRGARDPLA